MEDMRELYIQYGKLQEFVTDLVQVLEEGDVTPSERKILVGALSKASEDMDIFREKIGMMSGGGNGSV